MSLRLRAFVLTVVVAAAVAGCGSSARGPVKVPAGAVAQVGDQTITLGRLDAVLQSSRAYYRTHGKPFPAAKARKDAIDYLVQSAVLQQEAERLGIAVTDRKLDNAIEEMKADTFQGDTSQLLAAMRHEGLTLHEFREQEREQLTEQAIRGRIASITHVPDAQARAYYAKHKAAYATAASRVVRQILVKRRALAETIYRELVRGASFAALAKRYSIDSGTRLNGGRLVDTKGTFVAPFERVAFSLKTKEISKPVRSEFGWHVIQALAPVKPPVPQPYANVETAIKSLLLPSVQQKALTAFRKRANRAYCDGRIAFAPGYSTGFCARAR